MAVTSALSTLCIEGVSNVFPVFDGMGITRANTNRKTLPCYPLVISRRLRKISGVRMSSGRQSWEQAHQGPQTSAGFSRSAPLGDALVNRKITGEKQRLYLTRPNNWLSDTVKEIVSDEDSKNQGKSSKLNIEEEGKKWLWNTLKNKVEGADSKVADTDRKVSNENDSINSLWNSIKGSVSADTSQKQDTDSRSSTEEGTELKTKVSKLILSVIVDAIGFLTAHHILQFDFGWAPLSALIIQRLYHTPLLSATGFVEQAIPGLDFVPTASLGWVVENVPQLSFISKLPFLGGLDKNNRKGPWFWPFGK